MSKIIKPLVVLLLLFICQNIFSQEQRTIDSLKQIYQNPKIHDTTKLYSIALLMDQYNSNERKRYDWNDVLGKLASKKLKDETNSELKIKYTSYLGAYYNNLAVQSNDKGDKIKALEYFDNSIAIFKSINYSDETSYALIGKAVTLTDINDYKTAISYFFETLKYFEKDTTNNLDAISYVYSNIGKAYSDLNDYQKSIYYYNKAIKCLENKKNEPIVEDKNTKAEILLNCGSSCFLMKKYPEALVYFQKALSISKETNYNFLTSVIVSKIARIKTEELKFIEAESLLNEAVAIDSSGKSLANIYIRFGELYFKQNDLKKADLYFTKGLQLNIQNNDLALQKQATEMLYKINKKTNNFGKSLEMFELFNQLKDSSATETNKNTLERQELQYDFEKKEFNYKLAAQQKNAAKNNLLIGLSSALILLLFGGYFIYRNNKQKQAISQLEKNQIKQKLLITQMNPHFIFNSIDNIQGLIYNNQNTEAVNYLTKFSKLTRQILENSTENYISLSEEVEMIENYLVIQQLLYSSKFTYKIDVENSIDVETIFLPPMLTQPFIENAIKHGLSSKDKNGEIEILFYLKLEKLYFEVTDNGNGFKDSKKTENHKSLAMTITKERLVNYTKNQEFSVQTENIIDKNEKILGAKVVFEIPYIYENN